MKEKKNEEAKMSINLPAVKAEPDSNYPMESEELSDTELVKKEIPTALNGLDEHPDADSVNGENIKDKNPEKNEPFNGDLA